MDENNPVRDVRQVERLLYSRIAATHDRDSLVTEEEAVACRARRQAESPERLFGRNTKPFRLSTRRIDQRIAEIVVPAVTDKTKRCGRIECAFPCAQLESASAQPARDPG